MQKIITTAMLSLGVIALAQTGNVGINNQQPKATLHLDVASANLTDATLKTSNQGILIPQLTKQRIADIAKANLLDGTMVYANAFADITQTDAETQRRVSQITTKDFYKYNVERDLWERMSSKRLTKEITANYTLSETDYHYYLYVNSANEVTISIPETLKDGFSCIVVQEGIGEVIMEGTHVKSANGQKTNKQHSAIGVVVRNGIATITGDTKN